LQRALDQRNIKINILPSCVTPSTELQETNEKLSTVSVGTDKTHSQQQQTNNMERLATNVHLSVFEK